MIAINQQQLFTISYFPVTDASCLENTFLFFRFESFSLNAFPLKDAIYSLKSLK